MNIANNDKIKKIASFFAFCLCLFYAVPHYNATVSIAVAICVLMVLFRWKENLAYLGEIPKSFYYALGIYVGSCFLSSIAIGDLASVNASVKILYWALPCFLTFLLCRNHLLDDKLMGYAFHLALLLSVVPAFLDKAKRVTGLYGNPNHFSTMLDILLPFCFIFFFQAIVEKKNKALIFLYAANVFAGSYVLHLTGSRGAILGVLAGAFVLAFCFLSKISRRRTILCLGLCLLLLAGARIYNGIQSVSVPDSWQNKILTEYRSSRKLRTYDTERELILQSSYNMWNDHKLFGVGLDNWSRNYRFRYISPKAKEPRIDMAHNTIAYYFSAGGLVAGFGYCAIMLYLFVFLWEKIKEYPRRFICMGMLWAFMAIFVHGFFDTGITMKIAARLFYACLGIALAEAVVRSQQ